MTDPIALGWRVHSWSAVVVAVRGPLASPSFVRRDLITLNDDPASQEAYHAAVGRPLDEVPDLLGAVAASAASAATSAIAGIATEVGGPVIGVVGGNRRLPDLDRILSKHALLHAAERQLYEAAVIEGATSTGCTVTALPATGTLLDEVSDRIGVPVAPLLTALGAEAGRPWQKEHREAAAAALAALAG